MPLVSPYLDDHVLPWLSLSLITVITLLWKVGPQETWFILSPSCCPMWFSGQLCSNSDLSQVSGRWNSWRVYFCCVGWRVLCVQSVNQDETSYCLRNVPSLASRDSESLRRVWSGGCSRPRPIREDWVCDSKSVTGPPGHHLGTTWDLKLMGTSVF